MIKANVLKLNSQQLKYFKNFVDILDVAKTAHKAGELIEDPKFSKLSETKDCGGLYKAPLLNVYMGVDFRDAYSDAQPAEVQDDPAFQDCLKHIKPDMVFDFRECFNALNEKDDRGIPDPLSLSQIKSRAHAQYRFAKKHGYVKELDGSFAVQA